ncbi:MAG: DoxX family protein [Chitinophagaceae bacterium]|nr:DoxX family protein [Chitinophagaceae bacterium]
MKNKIVIIAVTAAALLLSAVFLVSGIEHFTRAKWMEEHYLKAGFSLWGRFVIGPLQLTAAAGLAIRKTRLFTCIVVCIIMLIASINFYSKNHLFPVQSSAVFLTSLLIFILSRVYVKQE